MEKVTLRRRRLDFPLFLAAITLWVFGIFLVYSATYFHETGALAGIYVQQIMWVAMGLFIVIFIVSIPGRLIFQSAYILYGVSLLLLAFVIVSGVATKGAERWISVAGFRIQPSEFAKVGYLLALARYLSEKSVSLQKPTSFIVPLILLALPAAMVLRQPDLGTALVFFAMTLPMFYWSKLSSLDVFYIVSPLISMFAAATPLLLAYNAGEDWGVIGALPWGLFFIIVAGILYINRAKMFLWIGVMGANIMTGTVVTIIWESVLKDYQKARIMSFMNPQSDPFGAGYQVIQSQVAIGSGHIFGKGYLQGTQSRLSFLPEQHTDFIFSVLGEQFGLVGCAIVILLFMFIIMRGLMQTRECKNRFINLVTVGACSILCFHVFVNIAITIGIMPVTGLPLPFLSYGGSFTITVATLVGLLLNAKITDQDF